MAQYNPKRTLAASALFNVLNEQELDLLVPLCSLRNYREGEEIIHQGQRVEALYIIASGKVAIVRQIVDPQRRKTSEVTVETLGPGRLCGWSALVEPSIATASAKTLAEVQAVIVDGPSLRTLMEKNPSVNYALMKRLVELLALRLRQVYQVLDTHL